ncbi:proline racemase [Acinetobacter baumannii UH7607]|nr:proline racemase [Acinetobacter baumannii UH22908]ETR14127.1 proline racemase [Acinetobacter baumannii UH7607]ETR22103.1 proline racemase [Acinetobacter baumannii UH7907]
MINVVGAHAGGERNDVITGGVLDVPGQTMFDKMTYLQEQKDEIRKLILQEPRGNVTQCVNLVLPSNHPNADAGFVIMESEYYVPMSGTNTICTVTVLLETGMIPMVEPITRFTLEAPGGLVGIEARCENGKCIDVKFKNVPCFVFGLDKFVEVEGLGTVKVDVSYGGMIYAIVDAQSVGFSLTPDEAADLVEVGERIKKAAAQQVPAIHPEQPLIHTINQTLFAGSISTNNEGLKTAKNAVIVSPGRLDRSPCGTGTSARLAVMHARGQIGLNEKFVHESVIGSKFTGIIEEIGSIAGQTSITPSITGSAWITGFYQHVLDASDPFPEGFTLGDTWKKERN